MNLETLLSTDWRLLEPLCDITRCGEYTVFQSRRFPDFYGANGIYIQQNNGRALTDWEQIFDMYFEQPLYEHKTFSFLKDEASVYLEEQALAAEYNVVQTLSFMQAAPHPWEGEQPDIRRVQSEREWNNYRAMSHDTGREEAWYSPGGCDRLFNKMRYQTEALDIHWLYIPGLHSDMIGAIMGVFLHNGMARLQDVMTHPECRRRGLANRLLRHVMGYAGGVLGAENIVVCADTDYFAIDFYRKVGFQSVGEIVELMKYAKRDA